MDNTYSVTIDLTTAAVSEPDQFALALIGTYATRVTNLANETTRAHQFGVVPKRSLVPWTRRFQEEAVLIYAETLPVQYLWRVALAYTYIVDLMDSVAPADQLTREWSLLRDYFRLDAEAVSSHLRTPLPDIVEPPELLQPTPPGMIRYDRLATLVAVRDCQKLARIAESVRAFCHIRSTKRPSDSDIEMLRDLCHGTHIADLAAKRGQSTRTMYRRLSRLWDELGVADAHEAILLGGREGWLS